MSLFGETISAQQAMADEPRKNQAAALAAMQAFAAMNAQRQQNQIAQQRFKVDQTLAQREAAAFENQQGGEAAYMQVLRDRAAGGASGPGVGIAPGMGQAPQMEPLSFDTVSASLLKKNPNMKPAAFIAAMEKFAPQFEAQDKAKLAQATALARQQAKGPGSVEEQLFSAAIKGGGKLTPEMEAARNIAEGYKRSSGVAGATVNPDGSLSLRSGAEGAAGAMEASKKGAGTAATKAAEEAASIKARIPTQQRITSNLTRMAGLYRNLAKRGALVDPAKPAEENVIARLSASSAGQLFGGALGTESQAVRDEIAMMRPTLLNDIRKASEQGARGLDSDRELEFYLQAATDPTRPLGANLAALAVLNDAYGLGATQFTATPDPIATLQGEFKAATDAEEGAAPSAAAPVPNAKQAPDGNWYLPDPNRPGKYLQVQVR